MLHLSFRDFLFDSNKDTGSHFWIEESKAQEKLAASCLRLMGECLREDICSLKGPGTSMSDVDENIIAKHISTELRYACLNWVFHTEGSRHQIEDNDAVHEFLKAHFLHWIEVLSLLGNTYQAVRLVRQMRCLLKVCLL